MTDFGIPIDMVIRTAVAIALGAAVGIEREIDDQPAGLRTHITVSLGAALFGVISTLGFDEYMGDGRSGVQVDVTRVASQVVVGIGFVGAGVIFRNGPDVRNVTTAMSLWVTAAIGLAAGVGNIGAAAVATAMLLVTLRVLLLPRSWVRQRLTRHSREIHIELRPGAGRRSVLDELAQLNGIKTRVVAVQKREGADEMVLELKADPGVDLETATGRLVDHADVVTLVRSEEHEPD